jgi:response regulator RpfG family c-di-GMP phosphodiesterase
LFKNNLAIAVDDNEMNVMLIESMAHTLGLPINTFTHPVKACEFIKNNELDIAFVDYQMPVMNGIELTYIIREKHPSIPIIMITGMDDDRELKLKAIEAGATDFMNKPLNTYEFLARVKNLLKLRHYQLMHENRAKDLAREVDQAVQEVLKRELETLRVLGRASEYKDSDTNNHVRRVAFYSRLLSEKLGQSAKFQETIYHAAPLHDIGKIGIPDHVLLKPGRLTSEEFDIIKTHSEIGYNILNGSKSMYLQAGALIARSHHEKIDGSGYPLGLKGTEIPIMGRIVAVVDVFDALTCERPYKKAWPFEMAVKEIRDCIGSHFDKSIVKAFLGSLPSIKSIMEQFSN